jgi:predicted MPP superfamily phosphohydrolase
MYSREDRKTMIEKTIDVVKQIKNEQKQLHIIAGILTATDKFIDEEYAKRIREWLKTAKVVRIFEQEKKEAIKESEKQKAFEIAKNLLDVLPISVIAKRTSLTVAEVADLAKEETNPQKRG